MSVPSEVYGLVERFDRNREEYRSGRFNETQVRVDFIDPLMGLLGWDVHNRQGRPEAYRSVIHEDRVKVGGGTKAPDYGLYAMGQCCLFLEDRALSPAERHPSARSHDPIVAPTAQGGSLEQQLSPAIRS